jgi:phage regulator Rha-like protein
MAIMVTIPQEDAALYGLDEATTVTVEEFTKLEDEKANRERIEANRAELTRRLDDAKETLARRERLFNDAKEAVAVAEENLRTGNLPKRGRPSNGDSAEPSAA